MLCDRCKREPASITVAGNMGRIRNQCEECAGYTMIEFIQSIGALT